MNLSPKMLPCLEQVMPRTLSAEVAPRFFMDSQSPSCFLGGRSASMDRTPTPSFHTPMQDFAGHHTPSFQLTASATASAFLERLPSFDPPSFALPAFRGEDTTPATPPESSLPDAVPLSQRVILGRTRGHNAHRESEVQHTDEPSARTSSAAQCALIAHKAYLEKQARRQSRLISTTE